MAQSAMGHRHIDNLKHINKSAFWVPYQYNPKVASHIANIHALATANRYRPSS
jgi:hypothetical protein